MVAAGDNARGQCEVSDWTDIIAVSTGEYYTLGLKSDGTVVAAGQNWSHRLDVSQFSDIVAISADSFSVYVLTSQGQVLTPTTPLFADREYDYTAVFAGIRSPYDK